MIRLGILSAVALCLGACESAEITIQADLYGEETAIDSQRRAEREDQNLTQASNEITKIRKVAEACGENVKDVASQLVKVTVSYRKIYKTPSSNFVLEDFKNDVKGSVDKVAEATTEARRELANFIAVSLDPDLDMAQRRNGLVEAQAAYDARVRQINELMPTVVNAFQADNPSQARIPKSNIRTLGTGLAEIRSNDTSALTEASEGQRMTLAENLGELASRIKAYLDKCAQKAPTMLHKLRAPATQLENQNINALQQSVVASVVGIQFFLKNPVNLSSRAIFNPRRLAIKQAFYLSQVDRLQDPADPAWREILAKTNQNNWRPLFARTTFRAEGKSDVIVVRDRPGHYRVQRGVNNPAALIQGQLEISRSVASAATAVLGAVSGVNVPLVAGGSGAIPGSSAAVPGVNGSQTLKGEAARVDEAQRVRSAARIAMSAELENLIRDLLALSPSDTNGLQRIYARAVPTLKAHAALLEFTGKVK